MSRKLCTITLIILASSLFLFTIVVKKIILKKLRWRRISHVFGIDTHQAQDFVRLGS